MLRTGDVSSEEVVRAHIGRIEAVDPKVGAFTTVFAEQALRDAKARDAARKATPNAGPLYGLPVTVKECLNMEGLASTVGLRSRVGHRAPKDAALVTLLREAGAVIIGRTNLSQCMIYAESSNPVFGRTKNPFNLARTPGGSSGGEAAAIASGMSCLGVGTDIGGSIRNPAAYTGIFGLMPTLDRLPLTGSTAGIPGQESVRAAAGPMARHAKDLSLFLSALSPERMSALDPRTPPLPFAQLPTDLKGLRVGLLSDDGVLAPSRGYYRALSLAQGALEARGAEVVPFHTNLCEEAVWLYLAVMSSDGARTMRELLEGEEVDPSLAGLLRVASMPQTVRGAVRRALTIARKPRMAKVLEALGEKTVTDVWKLHVRMRDVRARMLAAWDEQTLDVVLTPPAATPALPHGGTQDFVLGMTYTFVWNLMHFPAGVAPVTRVLAHEEEGRTVLDRFDKKAQAADTDSLGLPLGVQIVGRPFQEHKVLAMLEAIEAGVHAAPSFPTTPVDPRAA